MAKYALVIGINRYDHFRHLKSAAKDAEAIAQILEHPQQRYKVTRLPRKRVGENQWAIAPDKPVYFAELSQELINLFQRRAKYQEVVLYFAGHGFRVRDKLANEERGYLATSDATADGQNAILFDSLNKLLGEAELSSLVVLLDCCYAGSILEEQRRLLQPTQSALNCKPNSCLIAACRDFEQARESKEHGIFTAAVLQGLSVENAVQGAVTSNDLFGFVERELRNSRQEVIHASMGGAIALVQYPLASSISVSNDTTSVRSEPQNDASIHGHQSNLDPTQPNSTQNSIFKFSVITVDRFGRVCNRHPGEATSRQEFLAPNVTLDLVRIEGGTFLMGTMPDSEDGRSYNEDPQHEVTVPRFWISRYPITQLQWNTVSKLPVINHHLTSNPSQHNGSHRPVECISWNDAVEFCARLTQHLNQNFCLPSEAEWEYACRARTQAPFHFGETITSELVNYDSSYPYQQAPKGIYLRQTTEIGHFSPNAFGLYDMHGNVWEWCIDSWHSNYVGAPIDGSAWNDGGDPSCHVLRGGAWNSRATDCRSAIRLKSGAAERAYNYGLRVVSH